MNRFAVIRKIDSLDSRSDVYTSEPIPCGAVSDPSSRDLPQSPMEDTQGSLTAAVQGTRSYYECNLQTQQPGHPQNHCDNKKYDSGKLSVYFVGRTNASDSEDEKLLFKVYNIVHNDIEGDDFDENEDSVDVNDDKLINDLIVHGSSVKVGDHFVFIVFGPDIVGVSI